MHYRQLVFLAVTVLVLFGIYGLLKMNKNEFPNLTIRQGVVVAVYPGVSPMEMEQQVTKPLEDYIFTYKEVNKQKTRSNTKNGMVIVQVELNDEISEAEKERFWSRFKFGMQQFKSSLPQGVLTLITQDDFGDTAALLITMESQDKTYRELHEYMKQLKEQLRQVESVGKMTVYGEQMEQISVQLDNNRLSQYGVGANAIMMQLLGKGFVTTAGTVKTDSYDSPILVSSSINMVNDVEQTVVFSDQNGNVVRLKDIATVKREYAEPQSYVTMRHASDSLQTAGTKCIVLSVEMKRGRSITDMGSEIDNKLKAFEQTLPRDVKLTKITDQPHVVGYSVVNFLKELLIAIIAVMIVVILLMPIRVALVAASTIPLTIFISLGIFYAFDIELNTATLAALIVSLGMVVDNSIVIIDNYVEKIAEGQSRWHASIESAQHFFKSILTATLAISVTFFPFLFTLTGVAIDFLKLFPWAVLLILLVSLAIAELVVPFLQFYFIRKPLQQKLRPDGRKPFSLLDWTQRYYDRLIDVCFRHPYMTIGAGVLSVVVAACIFPFIPQKLMPKAERNQFAVEMTLPTGTSLNRTAELADSLERILIRDPRVVSIASFKGTASPRFHSSYAPQQGGPNFAQFIVNTISDEASEEMLEDYRMQYMTAFPEAYVRFKQMTNSAEANPVEVRLQGDDWETLKQTADSLTRYMRAMPELMLVRNDVLEPLLTTTVTLDEEQSARLGINNATVETSLMSRYNSDGLTVGTVWNGDYATAIRLKGSNADRGSEGKVDDELMGGNMGLAQVPLNQVAQVNPVWHDGQISHRNGRRTITIMSEVANGVNVTAISTQLEKKLRQMQLPEGVTMEMGGEIGENADMMPRVISALMMAIAIIFFLLVFHFKHIGTAVLLLVSQVLVLFGTVVSVLIQGIDFSLTCFFGVISLMGILVRNAIIMYDYAEELQRTEKLSAHDAIYHSAKRRMRPIFLTSAAASMGVIPMILGGSGMWSPMGAVICYGTIITMLLILTVLPIGYWKLKAGTIKKRTVKAAMEKE